MKKTAQAISLSFVALLAVFFVPYHVDASTLKANSVSTNLLGVNPPNVYFQGLGLGSEFATGTPAGIRLWFGGLNNATTTGNLQACLIEFDTKAHWEASSNHSSGTGFLNGVCTTLALKHADANGFIDFNLTWSTSMPSAVPTHYFGLQVGNFTSSAPTGLTGIVGSSGFRYGDDVLYTETPTATTASSIFWLVYSGSAPSFTTFDASTFFPTVSTTSVTAVCNQNFATTTGVLDTIGASFANGICLVGAYLFIPSVDSLNQFSNVQTVLQSKIPFSYFYALADIYDGLTATGTSAVFQDIEFDISSTSVKNTAFGSIIPTVKAFSTTTIGTYISPSILALLRTLMASTIWLGFAYVVFRRVSGLFRTV